MRPTTTISILFALFSFTADAQVASSDLSVSFNTTASVTATQPTSKKRKLNFFVISKRKKGKLDLATRFNVFRTRIKGLFRKKRFKSIIAADAQEASDKIRSRLNNKNGRIGTLWFDSHGMYKKGHSVFFIGKDEFSYRTLKDTCHDNAFEQLALYADNETNIVIGSCYGGATYNRMSVDYKDTTRMNGDSLMMALGNIFSEASIYASESWVMTKPGLFRKKAAVAGFPGGKLYRDLCYQPVWENVGKWNRYNARTDSFSKVNPVTLNRNGSLMLLKKSYIEKNEVKNDIMKKLEKLETGLYK